MVDRLTIAEARGAFSVGDELAYLDTATQGLPCAAGVAALGRAVDAWAHGTADHELWEQDADASRVAVAALLGVPARDVALVPSVALTTATFAAAVAGPVVVPAAEYRSNCWPWLVGRDPADVRLVAGAPRTEDLIAAIDERTRIVAVSAVQSADGHAVDLPRVVAAAHAHDALVVVDATQALGATAAGIVASGADVIVATGYKWLCGARGTGFAYVRPRWQELLPIAPGPRAAADGGAYGPELDLHADARRFDGSAAWLPWVATRPGVELLARVGADVLQQHSLGLVQRARDGLAAHGLRAHRVAPEGPSPILSVPCADPERVAAALRDRGLRCAARPGVVRAGLHLFTTDEQVDRLVDALAATTGPARDDPRGSA